ncbi:MAG: LysR substrate-binding domain-containing protein [Pelistega sp.]|nr:LysR substrate-binding domain-containing protein [Pelistega sp.]
MSLNFSRIDPIALRIFLSAAQYLSLTKTATEMHMTLSAISKRISDLERQLQCTLFVRLPRGLELTTAGHALVEHAQYVLGAIQRLGVDMNAYALGLKGQVRIWANTSSVIQFLPKDLALFSQEHPDIRLSLEERNSYEIISALTQGQIDIGIFADNAPSGQLEKFFYREDRLVLLSPLHHVLATHSSIGFQEALDYDFVGLSSGASLHARLQEAAERVDKPFRLRVQVNSFDAICRMIEAGLGIGILPIQGVRPEILGTQLCAIELNDSWANRTLWLGTRLSRGLTPEAEKLLDFLKQAHLNASN